MLASHVSIGLISEFASLVVPQPGPEDPYSPAHGQTESSGIEGSSSDSVSPNCTDLV